VKNTKLFDNCELCRVLAEVPHWTNAGPFFREKPAVGTLVPIPHFVLLENGMQTMKDLPVVATSYNMTTQFQEVDLETFNISSVLMDELQPTIIAEEWYHY